MNTRGHEIILIMKAVVLSVVLALSSHAFAQDKGVGTIVRALGENQVLTVQGERRELRLQDRVSSGDTVITGNEGWLTINFYDLTRIVLRPNTEFKIEKFPETLDAGKIKMQIVQGAARVSTGTIASQSLDQFSLTTPNGLIQSGRAEWVVRICEGQSCDNQSTTARSCSRYQKPETVDKQFVSVYAGEIAPAYCSTQTRIKVGESAVSELQSNSCKLIPEVPCFVLFDKKLGRDKARALAKNLKPAPGYENSKLRPPPRHERPSQRGDHRRPPPGGRPPPRRAPRR